MPHPSRHPRRGPSLEPTNSLQPGLQARRQVPELTISFTSPNTHPKTATPGDPSQATVATAHTVTGTPSKRYKPWSGKLPSRFLILSNELPRFGDASGAIANRFVVLALHESFLGKENRTLTEELTAELTGILSWSLDGLDRLTRQGKFTEPRSSDDSILALQDLVSPTAAFAHDRCEVGIGYKISVADLFVAWKTWAEDNGPRNVSRTELRKASTSRMS